MTKEDIINCLIYNQLQYKELCKDVITQKNHSLLSEPNELHSDIVNQFNEICKKLIADEITKSLACDYESVMVVLGPAQMEEYFKL